MQLHRSIHKYIQLFDTLLNNKLETSLPRLNNTPSTPTGISSFINMFSELY